MTSVGSALLISMLIILGVFSATQIPGASSDNPLEECPDSPNCQRSSQEFKVSPERTLEAVLNVLEKMNAESVEQTGEFEVHAVFRIRIFGFRDDVHLALTPHEDGDTLVHIRSASRTGYSDLGVNGRRVNRFYRMLADELR
ncbi:MAG: DUF1499 domain-containing protein [Balneolia bacterium]|nr:DUF1499 domain-containing protein [Balneolia bacterium]